MALRLGYHASEEDVRAAILAQFPAFVLGGSWGSDTTGVVSAGPNATFDLPIFNRNQGQIAQTRATRILLQQQYQARLDSAVASIRGLAAQGQKIAADLAPARRAAAAARSLAQTAHAAYAQGNLDQRSWTDYETTALQRELEVVALERSLDEDRILLDRRAWPRTAVCGGDRGRWRAAAMKRRFVLTLACGALAFLPAGRVAAADSQPSVLVQLAKLEPGSLPQIVRAYGSIQPSAGAKQTIMAPVSAQVDAVYVRAGAAVGKGAALLRLAPSPATAAAYDQAQSALRAASQLVAGTSKLVEGHLATRQQLVDAEKSQSDARSALVALQAQGADRPHILRAPHRAIVTGLSTSPGALVSLGAALLDLARPNGLVLMAGAVPAQAAGVKPGDAAAITPLGGRSTYAGKIVSAAAVVDPASGLVPIEIALPPGKWLPGEMAEAAITTGQLKGYVVPRQALLVDDTGATYVVQAVNRTARKVAVRLLGAEGDRAVIAGPLDAAAPLVLAGNYQLENGMKVRVADPSGTAAGGKPQK